MRLPPVVWLLASFRLPARGYARKRSSSVSRANAEPRSGGKAASLIQDAERTLAEARREAEALLAKRGRRRRRSPRRLRTTRETLLADAKESAGRSAAEIRNDAKRTARAIVQEAERKASEIVSEADCRRLEAERELSRDREIVKDARHELTKLLLELLAEVKDMSGERPTNVYALDEAHGPKPAGRAAQGGLRASERPGRKGDDGDR